MPAASTVLTSRAAVTRRSWLSHGFSGIAYLEVRSCHDFHRRRGSRLERPTGSDRPSEPGTTLRSEQQRPEVPLLLGAWGPRGAALAGRIAGEIKVGGSANPDMVPVMRERLLVGASRIGRDVAEIGVVLGAVTVVDTDGEAARARARTEVAMYLAVVAELDPTVALPDGLVAEVGRLVDAGRDEEAGTLIPDDVLDRFAFSGTPEQVARQAQSLIDAGVRRVEFGTPHGLTDDRGVELLGTEVLPLLSR
ncbi:LLM class flavin-dependent oxidoreductase [Paractinoplanes maris]|uniref:LLM class flavin-dependent oxidoreductase n=1 Tax=Paractinoplanes maris TaxID=1734446 RepID=UPI0027E1449B|nr:LLM class flavin-dependent oxidoreductase [Actinoplanes maris]